MKLSPAITLLPVVHGRSAFAGQVRALFSRSRFDCVAIDLPEPFQEDLGPAVDALPCIQAVLARGVAEESCFYVPIDPCDAMIEAVRQARNNRIPFFCIGGPAPVAHRPLPPLPDEYAGSRLGFDIFDALCLHLVGNPETGSAEDSTGRCCAEKLRVYSAAYKNILALVHFRSFARAVFHFRHPSAAESHSAPAQACRTESYYVNPDHLYFALGELPFVTGKFERERHDPLAPPSDTLTEIKNLFRETRDSYDDRKEAPDLSPARIQTALTYLRNLTVESGSFLPSLFDIVEAAKGVGGNGYALRILKNAKYYPYLPFELESPLLGVGLDAVALPDSGDIIPSVNLFRDTALEWRTVSLRPDPSIERRKKYRYAWNPAGACSHVPEDVSIERFNAHVRAKTRRVLIEEFAKHEPFTTSVKDGIDIRETLRNWHTGNIYVKELPPSRGKIDTVIVIFDADHDEDYPNRTTWYAEHGEESTLTFYATDPFADLIGPGIARCRYGGLSLLFPPRPVPNIFEITDRKEFSCLASQLACGAMLWSGERVVAYAAARKPGAELRRLARLLKKRLVWIPLVSFSNETLRRLRRFHILNGKEVRSWAARFIGEG